MAATVHNSHFTSHRPPLNGDLRTFKSGSTHRRNDNNGSVRSSVKVYEEEEEDLCSEDENEMNAFRDLIERGNSELEPSILDPRHERTADNWIERNSSLVRLTGKHPFNSEPPLNRLMHHGFITPAPLHFVRSHGAVPKATWNDWTVDVCGLVKRPTKFTMDQLTTEFAFREFPATMVCAGNRRKEQNMVKQTIGFNWGAAVVSTSVWRGVPLRDVLKRCGILSRKNGALNVCFEGAEDLAGGGGSKYGTSIKIEIAMDPARDIILAYMQNGEELAPDHGFPVRMIMPGFIGGKMVKWLKRIIVTTKESDSYYYFMDNKVFPSQVDAEQADKEGWWYKAEYVINEYNINSVITTPSHHEILLINSWSTRRFYTLRGYAYSGGGKKVTRVEVTMDGGETWDVCMLDHPAKPNKFGKYWCWCLWSLEVEVLELLGAKEIAVRAWDETNNTQPDKLIWNLMGLMNNCWFRVKTKICKPQKGEFGIIFEHPTIAGNQSGGWMDRERHSVISSVSNQALKKSVSTPFMNTASNAYSLSEVKKHNSPKSAWIIVHGHVYDCTRFIKDHPGGSDSILVNAGTDCTDEFDAIHSDKAKKMLEDYRIGELITTGYTSDSSATNSPNNSTHRATEFTHLTPTRKTPMTTPRVALAPNGKIACKLVSKTAISGDVRLFRFALPSQDLTLGLPVGKHIFICATVNGKLCMRAYTPTSSTGELGYFELVVKVYFKNMDPKFPNGGLMSQYLDSMEVGSTVDVKGPSGHIEYTGRGNFIVHGKPRFAKRLAMLAGGFGITPIYQLVQAIMKDPEDETEMFVVYANRTEKDILLREKLDRWASKNDRLKVWYVVEDSIRQGWEYSIGLITESILRDHIPPPAEDTLALVCGPPPMIQFAVQPNLEKMNYDTKNSFLVF